MTIAPSTTDPNETCDELGIAKHLTFRISDERYAVPLDRVIEIVRMQQINRVPNVPEYVRGLINLRGRVVPVMDVRLRLGLGPREYDDRTCIIVLRDGTLVVGAVVDRVTGVVDIAPDRIESMSASTTTASARAFIHALARLDHGVEILLDVTKLVRDPRLQGTKSRLDA